MLLKNCVTAMAMCFILPNAPSPSSLTDTGLKNRNGSSFDLGQVSKDGFAIWNSSSDYPLGACFGSGTTPVSSTDYNVETEISDISASISRVISYSGNQPKCTITITGQYNGASEVSLSEIGFYKGMAWRYPTDKAYQLLIYREVLSEPIVLNNGDNFTIVRDWVIS
jgi:hypothetical protein